MADRFYRTPRDEDPVFESHAVSEAEIRTQLSRILSSAAFRQSDRLRAFLQFAVNESIAGRTQSISAPTIAVEVFGNGRDLDQKSESLVRVQARQLRLKLNQYYDVEGVDDAVRIEMPTGGYAVAFRRHHRGPIQGGRIFGAQAVRNVAIILQDFDYTGANADLYDELWLLRDCVSAELAAFDFVSVSTNPGAIGGSASDPLHPSSLVLSAKLTERGAQPNLVVSLQSAISDLQVWSRKYVLRDMAEIEEWISFVSRHIAVNIAATHGPAIRYALEVFEHQTDLADPVFLLTLRGMRYLYAPTAVQNRTLLEELEVELEHRPASATGLAMSARLRADAFRYRFRSPNPDPSDLDIALEAAQQAVTLNAASCFAWRVLASIRYALRDMDRARAAAKRALDLNRNDTEALMFAGHCFWDLGDFDTGVGFAREAMTLSDSPPSWYNLVFVHDAIRLRQFEEAMELVANVEMGPFFWTHFLEAVIFGQLGRDAGFRKSFDKLKAGAPWLEAAPHDALQSLGFPSAFIEPAVEGFNKGKRRVGEAG